MAPVITFRELNGYMTVRERPVADTQLSVRVYNQEGDRRLIWDANDPDLVKEAKAIFEEYLTKEWRPYAVDKEGNVKRRIYAFDPTAEEIYFDDKKTVSEKLTDFVKKFRELSFTPRTWKG